MRLKDHAHDGALANHRRFLHLLWCQTIQDVWNHDRYGERHFAKAGPSFLSLCKSHFSKACASKVTFQKPARQNSLFKSLRIKSHFSKACASKVTFQKPARQKPLFKSLRVKSHFSKACVLKANFQKPACPPDVPPCSFNFSSFFFAVEHFTILNIKASFPRNI